MAATARSGGSTRRAVLRSGSRSANPLAAVDRVIKLQDRAAKMLGTDAPEKVEASVTQVTQEDIALAELVREARAQAAVEEQQLREQV